ncbi:MAG: hypothetical protein PHV37_07960 [Candidatus Gastranaerophilales bacterium]|nr:hypothetical protein [Candidatus Gastranaerophilales bacterium]
MLNNPNEWHNIEDENQQNQDEAQAPSDNVATEEDLQELAPNQGDAQKIKKIIIVVVIFLALLAIGLFKHTQDINKDIDKTSNQEEMGDYFYDQAKSKDGSNETATVEVAVDSGLPDGASVKGKLPADDVAQGKDGLPPIAQAGQDKDLVFVSIGGGGRENPFIPTISKSGSSGPSVSYPTIGFDLIEPPKATLPDVQAEELMQTTISGIMFDSKKPSAIVNINGKDQLVRVGDRLAGFTILNIARDKVIVKAGTNVFRAYVGQSFTTDGVVHVANLQNKFGGAYNGRNIKSLRFDN